MVDDLKADALTYEDALNETKAAKDDDLKTVATLGSRLLDLLIEADDLTARLKATNESARLIREVDLPEAMDTIGMAQFLLTDGSKVEIKTIYRGYITKENQANAFAWLEANGHGSLIKRAVTITFGRGEGKLVEGLLKFLQAKLPTQKRFDKSEVHPQTLYAFIKEQMLKHTELPPSLGAEAIRMAKVTRAGGAGEPKDEDL